MNLKLVIFLTACLSYFAVPSAGTNLLAAAAAVKGAVIGAGLSGLALSASSGGETVVIQTGPETVAVAKPAHQVQQVFIQQDGVEYKPIHPITLVPVATISSSNSVADKLSNLWSGISNAVSAKTRAVGDFLRSFRGPPRIVLISVNKTTSMSTTTTTTTKKPKTKKPTTTHQPVFLEIIAVPQQRIYPMEMPVSVVEDCDKK